MNEKPKREVNPKAKQIAAVAAVIAALKNLGWDDRRRALIAARVLNSDDSMADSLRQVR